MPIPDPAGMLNNLWVMVSALLVFIMTFAVAFLEVGEAGEKLERSFYKSIIIAGTAIAVMGVIGFNIAFAPSSNGVFGDPLYAPGFLFSSFSSGATGLLDVWWSTTSAYFNTSIYTSAYFLFEAAFASVAFALVSVVALRKVKLGVLAAFSIVYFAIIWVLPAAWIWNPTGWLYKLGARDFAGGLVVHAAAGVAGLALVMRIWYEEKKMGLKSSPKVPIKINSGFLTLSILLLWVGWFGFNGGSVLAFGTGALAVVVATFLSASFSLLTTLLVKFLTLRRLPTLDWAANGVLMGLIVITPLAGFVSPAGAAAIGALGAFVYIAAEARISKVKWFSDPIGLFPGHFVGGVFGVLMIAVFAQPVFAAASGNASLPGGLLFGGGPAALYQLAVEAFAVAVVLLFVFVASYISIWAIGRLLNGITDASYYRQKLTKT